MNAKTLRELMAAKATLEAAQADDVDETYRQIQRFFAPVTPKAWDRSNPRGHSGPGTMTSSEYDGWLAAGKPQLIAKATRETGALDRDQVEAIAFALCTVREELRKEFQLKHDAMLKQLDDLQTIVNQLQDKGSKPDGD